MKTFRNIESEEKKKYVMCCTIWYHLCNFKNVKNIYGGVYLKPLHGCFSHFLNCTNGTKLPNASHMFCILWRSFVYMASCCILIINSRNSVGVPPCLFLILISSDNRIFDNKLSNEYTECTDCNFELNFSLFIATIYFSENKSFKSDGTAIWNFLVDPSNFNNFFTEIHSSFLPFFLFFNFFSTIKTLKLLFRRRAFLLTYKNLNNFKIFLDSKRALAESSLKLI